jgi:hypothetical protein
MSDYTELAQYHRHNPDPIGSGCNNTGDATDGCVFPGIEPTNTSLCFIGRPSLYEAMASMHDMPVSRVKELFSSDKKGKDKLARLEAENKELKADVEAWKAFAQAAEDAGLVITTLK